MAYDATPAPILHTDCLVCPVQSCLAHRGDARRAQAWSELLAPRQALMPGEGALFRAGDRLRSLYSVRGGCIKTFTIDAQGNERIRGFHFAGDLIGLDALGDSHCRSTAVAVVPSQVCVAPVGDLRELMRRQPEIAQRILLQMSRELSLALAIAGDYSAEQRLAAFLLHLRQRLGAGELLRLPMAQRDIGNYLRLANETVCRTLKRFEQRGWLAIGERGLRIRNAQALTEAASAVGLEDLPQAA